MLHVNILIYNAFSVILLIEEVIVMDFKFNGSLLKKIRVENQLEQKDLQELSGVAQGTISDLELNKKQPRFSTVKRLSEALKVEPIIFYINSEISKEILPKTMSDDLIDFVRDESNIEYLEVIKWAKESNITPSMIRTSVNVIVECAGNLLPKR